jgi:hypothetical protein
MAVTRYVLPLLVSLVLPLAASARETYQFSAEAPNARGVDNAKLQAIIPKLQMANGTSGTVGPAGGTLKLNGLTLEFPKGAVSKATKVQWLTLRHPDIVFGWVLEPRDTKVVKPLTLHSPKADLVFRVRQLGAYVLMADRKTESFHLVNLAMAPAKPPAKAPPAPKGAKAPPAPNGAKAPPGAATKTSRAPAHK